jgi:hypothetical protein
VVVVGHKYESAQDAMTLFKEDGGLETIPFWSKCSLKLERDWVLAVKTNLEKESGVDVKLNL